MCPKSARLTKGSDLVKRVRLLIVLQSRLRGLEPRSVLWRRDQVETLLPQGCLHHGVLAIPRLETCVGSREAAVAEDSTRIATDPASTNEPIHRRAAPPALGFPKEALSEIHQTAITVDPGCAATVSRQPSASGDRRVFRDMFCQWLHKYGISTQPCNRDSRVLRGRAGSRRWGGGTASYRLGGSQHPFYRGRLTWRAWQGGAAGCILLGCILLQSPMVWNGVGRPVAICQPLCMRMMVQGKQRIRRPRSLKIVERMVLKPKQIGCCPSGGQSLRQSAQCARKDPGWKGLESSFSSKAIAGRTKMGAIVQEGTNSWTFVSTLVDGIATTVQKAREDMHETNSERRRGDIKIQPEDFDEYYKMDREGHYSPCAFIHVRAATHPVAYCGRSETRKQPGRIQEM